MSDNYDGPQLAQKIRRAVPIALLSLRQQSEIERLRGLLRECCDDEGCGYGISVELLNRIREALDDEYRR